MTHGLLVLGTPRIFGTACATKCATGHAQVPRWKDMFHKTSCENELQKSVSSEWKVVVEYFDIFCMILLQPSEV